MTKSSLTQKLSWIIVVIMVGFYLWSEHRAHLMGYWPYLLLLLCPLMHLFMHGRGCGHKDDDHHDGGQL